MNNVKGLLEVKKLNDKIIHLIFDSQFSVCDTMARFAEFYESPKFKGLIFNRRELFSWFRKTYKMEYHDTWGGFNIPSRIFKSKLILESKLVKKELGILDILKDIKGKFYVIATHVKGEEHSNTITHELAHAFYNLYPDYKKNVNRLIESVDITPFKKPLLDLGYHEDVLVDEVNAYCVEDFLELLEVINDHPSNIDYHNLQVDLRTLFDTELTKRIEIQKQLKVN